jgi:hypothetical protein
MVAGAVSQVGRYFFCKLLHQFDLILIPKRWEMATGNELHRQLCPLPEFE